MYSLHYVLGTLSKTVALIRLYWPVVRPVVYMPTYLGFSINNNTYQIKKLTLLVYIIDVTPVR